MMVLELNSKAESEVECYIRGPRVWFGIMVSSKNVIRGFLANVIE